MEFDLPETGPQQEILKAEADRVLEYAKQYVQQFKEQQKKWEEMRLEQVRLIGEQGEVAKALVEESVLVCSFFASSSPSPLSLFGVFVYVFLCLCFW